MSELRRPGRSGRARGHPVLVLCLVSAASLLPAVPQAGAEPQSAPPSSEAAGAWTNVSSPNAPAPANELAGVACVTASDCWAVGTYSGGGADRTLIERWDGTSWRVVPSPNLSRTQDELAAVACASASVCWAVGHTFNNTNGAYETLIERWDGTSWTIVPSPNNASMFNFLQGVACASESDCWAVGHYYRYDPASGRNVPQTLIERWDGTSWSIVGSPNGGEGQYNYLTGVTCASATSCFAVGTYASDFAFQNLILGWDGASWALLPSPNGGSVSVDNSLYGVTCVSASNCFAVGIYTFESTYQTLIERWNGTSWSIVPSPNPSSTQHNLLFGVTCVSASNCWAVGYYGTNAANHQTLIERWNGTSWSIVPSPNTSAVRSDRLLGVACASASACRAVGYDDGSGESRTLIERWNGTSWSIDHSANGIADPPIDSFLNRVTCIAAMDCWAVGSYLNPAGTHQTLVAHWDGNGWSVIRSPNVGTPGTAQRNVLNDVTCVSASDCWAVGSYHNGTGEQTLIERWDGASWSIVTSPNPVLSMDNRLASVTCASATDCWAVGSSSVAGIAGRTLIERWDGTAWSIIDSPDALASTTSALTAVTCASAADCWAVGSSSLAGVEEQPLIERWDGTSWSVLPSPDPNGSLRSSLTAVTCVSASDCWAVGRSSGEGTLARTLIERWNGSSWSIVPSPNTGAALANELSDVTCASASECWAVGRHDQASSLKGSLIQRWDGVSWGIVASPSVPGTHQLGSVSCTRDPECWAVGYSDDGTDVRTRVLRYNLPPVARLAASPTSGPGPLDVSFDASASTDPNAGDGITAYRFDFGDGSDPLTLTAPFAQHVYGDPGRYTATVSVIDAHGAMSAEVAAVDIDVS